MGPDSWIQRLPMFSTNCFKGFLRTNNVDTNSRLCMSSAVVGYMQAFGSDGPPTCYDDIQHADVFLIIGANMAVNHPVLFQMIRKRRALDSGCTDYRPWIRAARRQQTSQISMCHSHLEATLPFLQLIAKRPPCRRAD